MNDSHYQTADFESFVYNLSFFHLNNFWNFHLPPVKMKKNTNKSKIETKLIDNL